MKISAQAKKYFYRFSAVFLIIFSFMLLGSATWVFIMNLAISTYRHFIVWCIAGLIMAVLSSIYLIHVAMKLLEKGHFTQIQHKRTIQIVTLFAVFIMATTAFITSNYRFGLLWSNDHENWGPYLSWAEAPDMSMTITFVPRAKNQKHILYTGKTIDTLKAYGPFRKKGMRNTITVRGLSPNTEYFYTIPGFRDSPTAFRTAPSKGAFTFVVYGDTRVKKGSPNMYEHYDMTKSILKSAPESLFTVNLGDLAYHKYMYMSSWDLHFDAIRELASTRPYLPVAGNHDATSRSSSWSYLFFHLFELPKDPKKKEQAYDYRIGNAYFLFVNPNILFDGCINWMDKKLRVAAKNCKWIFVFMHYPPWSSLRFDTVIRKRYSDLFDTYNVTVVFCSHNHFYERVEVSKKNTVTYIVSGGGGAKLHELPEKDNLKPIKYKGFIGRTAFMDKVYHFCKVRVSEENVSVEVIDVNGNVIDKIQF